MSTAELLAYIDANGLEKALDRFKSEPTDNAELRAQFEGLHVAWTNYNEAAGDFDQAIRRKGSA